MFSFQDVFRKMKKNQFFFFINEIEMNDLINKMQNVNEILNKHFKQIIEKLNEMI